jgi:hypothetical protein
MLKFVSMAIVSTMRAPRIGDDWHYGNEIIGSLTIIFGFWYS